MTQSDKIPRIPYRRQIYFDQLGEVHSTISGERALKFALPKFLYAPTPEELREMLRELRLECQWSQALLAAMMGIPKATLRAVGGWFTEPVPSGSKAHLDNAPALYRQAIAVRCL